MRMFALSEVAVLICIDCNFVFITRTVMHQIHINIITVVSSIFSGIQ